MNDTLPTTLRQLRLSGLLASLDVRLQEAQSHALNHREFLELILQDELMVRADRQLQRRLKAAGFRELKTLDDFEWAFNPSVKKKQIFDLASGRYLREVRDVLFLGPPGVGKSHLAQALGYQAVKLGHAVLYRSVFDVVRDFLHDEAFAGHDKILAKYLKPDLLITAQAFRRVSLRNHHAPLRNALDDDDQQSAVGGLGQVGRRRAQRHRYPRSLPAPRRVDPDQRQKLSPASARREGQGSGIGVKTSQCAHRL